MNRRLHPWVWLRAAVPKLPLELPAGVTTCSFTLVPWAAATPLPLGWTPVTRMRLEVQSVFS